MKIKKISSCALSHLLTANFSHCNDVQNCFVPALSSVMIIQLNANTSLTLVVTSVQICVIFVPVDHQWHQRSGKHFQEFVVKYRDEYHPELCGSKTFFTRLIYILFQPLI